MSSTFERKGKQFECGAIAHMRQMGFSDSHPVEVTATVRYCMSYALCADIFAFHSPCQHPCHRPSQVSSDSSQTNQILQLPWKQEIALLIASHSPLPLPPTNHMQTYGCYCWFIYHLLKKILISDKQSNSCDYNQVTCTQVTWRNDRKFKMFRQIKSNLFFMTLKGEYISIMTDITVCKGMV